MRIIIKYTVAICLLSISILLSSCSTKRNTAASRGWQEFTTRYNVYFNGRTHFDTQSELLYNSYEDDYSQLLPIDPAGVRGMKGMPQPTGDFKRTIEKMQKAIQLHSITKKPLKRTASKEEKAFRARTEFNPFLHNAWLTMARAQYLNGDFQGSVATSTYIIKNFTWLKDAVAESRIIAALSYSAMNWLYEAENVLHPLQISSIKDKRLRAQYYSILADIEIKRESYAGAIKPLIQAIENSSGLQKHRLYFLLGQLYASLGENVNAYNAFRAAGSSRGLPYSLRFNSAIKQCEVYGGRDPRREIKRLEGMARYESNNEFLDRIYCAIGNLALANRDTLLAQNSYLKAIEKSERGGFDRALSQLQLGRILFDKGRYNEAQPYYAEAIPVIPAIYPGYEEIKRRGEVLDMLSLYSGNLQLQDSLLHISRLTGEQQREWALKKIKENKDKEKEKERVAAEAQRDREREEYLERQNVKNGSSIQGNGTAPQIGVPNVDKSWYFYNQTAIRQGKLDFQRRWGSRRLEDDWRRSNKNSFTLQEADTEKGAERENSEASLATDATSEGKGSESGYNINEEEREIKKLIANIPNSKESRKKAEDIVIDALYNIGIIFKDNLEDYSLARKSFLQLEQRFPENSHRLDSYYNMYMMAIRENHKDEAERWRKKIINEFGDSPYGIAMRDPNYIENLRKMESEQENSYQKAYDGYTADNYAEVHRRLIEVEKLWPLSLVLPKLYFLDALSYLAEHNIEKFKTRLSEMTERWPDVEPTPLAASIIKEMKRGREPLSGDYKMSAIDWSKLYAEESVGADLEGSELVDDPEAPHEVVFAFASTDVNRNTLLYELARFNFSTFEVGDYDIEPREGGDVGMLIVKGFSNRQAAQHYRDLLAKLKFPLPSGVEIRIMPVGRAKTPSK